MTEAVPPPPDDEVVMEFPLYATSEAYQDAFLLQFPLISRNEPAEIENIWQFEDDYTIKLAAPQLDIHSTGIVERIVRTKEVTSTANLAIGIFHDKALHLTPINRILQARPVPQEEQQDIKGDIVTAEAMRTVDPFLARSSDDIADDVHVSTFKDGIYGAKLLYTLDMCENVDEGSLSSKEPQFQLFYYIIKMRQIKFSTFLKETDLAAHANDLLDTLLKYSYYVQGFWIVKSEFIKQADLPIRVRAARNFLIVLFHNKRILTRDLFRAFLNDFELNKNDVTAYLASIMMHAHANKIPYAPRNLNPSDDVFAFKYVEDHHFDNNFKEAHQHAQKAIEHLKDQLISLTKRPDLFDKYMNN